MLETPLSLHQNLVTMLTRSVLVTQANINTNKLGKVWHGLNLYKSTVSNIYLIIYSLVNIKINMLPFINRPGEQTRWIYPLTMIQHLKFFFIWILIFIKLDGVGPIDNRPSSDKLHHFVRKKTKKKKCDMWHLTYDMWLVTCDTWHVTCDTWHVICLRGGEHSLKISAP